MKKVILALAVLVLSMDLLAQQNDKNLLAQNSDSLKAFYPLHVGDYWEYAIGIPSPRPTAWRKVTGDTILPNGERYFVIIRDDDYSQSQPDTLYDRVTEDFEVMRYFNNDKGSGEQLLYELGAEMGDSWLSSDSIRTYEVRVDSVYGAEFLMETRIHKLFHSPPTRFTTLVHGIGLSEDGDILADGGNIYLRGAIINGIKLGTITSIDGNDVKNIVLDFELFQNYPNPFNPETRIAYTLAQVTKVSLDIYNVLGQKVRTLVHANQPAGRYHVTWDGKNDLGITLPGGIYQYRLNAIGLQILVKKMTLLK